MDFEAAIQAIAAPPADAHAPLYSVASVTGFSGYFVGKDQSGLACLLVATTDKREGPSSPIRLETIDVQFDLHCGVRKGSDPPRDGVFSIIRCRSVDRETVRYFLTVCQTIVMMLGDNPRRTAIASAINRLIAIFRRAHNPPTRTLIGLFGELYLIFRSSSVSKAVAAWRIDETARFDFTSGDIRLDVKTSAGRNRVHALTYEQCNPPPATVAVIASLLSERVANGLSLQSLIRSIEHRLGGQADLILKLREVIAATLGSSLSEALLVCYDNRLADASLRFFLTQDVPAIRGPLPLGVSGVSFSSDLSSLPGVTARALVQDHPELAYILPLDA